MKIAITGASGLLGWHAATRLHAQNGAARFANEAEPFEIVRIDRELFANLDACSAALRECDAVIHFAGQNRGPAEQVEAANPDIARRLIDACRLADVSPHVVYANSTHAASDTPYGRSKRVAGELLAGHFPSCTNLVLPHIFGEGARPDYNNVTATFIDRIVTGQKPDMNADGRVALLHAGEAAAMAIEAACSRRSGDLAPPGKEMSVGDLYAHLSEFHEAYAGDLFPNLSSPFDVALFNTYRSARFLERFPRPMKLNRDARGSLFEASRSAGGGGQTFLSWTHPGVTRGNHFHLRKIERFLVVEGEAIIRIRRVFGDEVWTLPVSGAAPAAVDMPTLHTHSIENTGDRPLLTLFWTNEVFDPAAPDTYADPVLAS